jgi:hypothetical protein
VSNALEDFERALVRASRALSARAEVPHATRSPNGLSAGSPATPLRGRLRRRARHLSVALQMGLALSSLSVLAGGGVATYLLLSGENRTVTLAAFDCETSAGSSTGINAITGDPLIDCAAAWPQATAGRSSAPVLAAWGTTAGREVAVAQPASWGPPRFVYRDVAPHWRRLPAHWTVDLGVVELTDQLSDISISPYEGPPCTYASTDERTVQSLLAADGLAGWRIVVDGFDRGQAPSAGCRFTVFNVFAHARTVELLQAPGGKPSRRPTPVQQELLSAGRVADGKLAMLNMSVNRELDTRCETVAAAAALWRSRALADGFSPATLAYWRAVNTAPAPVASRFDYFYTLVRQPPWQSTGSCAHVLVMGSGGGGVTVYVARITP